ncbi:Lens fiber membrane intrinsic protein [Branchiostoma belcheri]|nr:Lens fiber membrane intrinsic protein [Branchiostoma belcheri]
MDVRHLVGVVLTCVGLAFFLIGVITPVWVSHQAGIWPPCHWDTPDVAMGTKGLWEVCAEGKKGKLRCFHEKEQPSSSNGTGQPGTSNGTGQPSTKGTGQPMASTSNEMGEPNSSNGTGQPMARTSNGPGQPNSSNGTGQPMASTSNGPGEPSTNGTSQLSSSNGTGQPSKSNGTGQPRCSREPIWTYIGVNGYLTSVGESRIEVTLWRRVAAAQTLATVHLIVNPASIQHCLGNQTTTFHVTRFSVMLGLMLLLPGAFLAVTAACRGELDSELDGLEIFTTLIILGGVFGGIGALCYTCDYFLTHTTTPLGVSFYLTWIQTAFTVPGGILIWQKSKDELVSV